MLHVFYGLMESASAWSTMMAYLYMGGDQTWFLFWIYFVYNITLFIIIIQNGL